MSKEQKDLCVPASPSGLRPYGAEPAAQSQAEPLVPNALDDAIILAVRAHQGQVDKAGEPYILHPLRVMLACKREEERIAAVLHDTVEDCGIELGLIKRMFGPIVAGAVDALTRRKGEDYMDFIRRCGANRIACVVKLADLADNMDLSRLGREPAHEDARRQWKYGEARNLLLWSASGIAARSDETPQAVQPEGQEPGPKGDAPK